MVSQIYVLCKFKNLSYYCHPVEYAKIAENLSFFEVRKMGKKDVNMLSGSISKGLFTISIPVMVMNVVQTMFNILDMTILKSYDTDGMAVGAVGACGSLITLITGLIIGISAGANVIIAGYIGGNNHTGANRAVGTAAAFAGAAGVVLAAVGIAFAEVFLRWTNCPEVLLERATLYFRLYFSGVPFLMLYNFCAAIHRSTGDSRRPMIYLITGGLIKLLASFLLVAVLRKGIVGVAIATILGWIVTTACNLYALVKNPGAIRLYFRNIRFYRPELPRILRIGIPVGLQQGLYSFANVAITTTVNSFGPAATTGVSIANNFDGILYQICTATSLAVMPYVSQNIGAHNLKRAMQSIWKGILITVALGASFGMLSAVFSRQLSSLMSSDMEVIAFSMQKMVIISSTYFICGINDILCAALRGMGKSIAPTAATLVFMFGLRIAWVIFVFPLLPNLTFLYLCWPISWILSIVTLLMVFFAEKKKLFVYIHDSCGL